MRFRPEMLELYAITDRRYLHGRDLIEQVISAINGGATMIQLREKNIGKSELLKIAVIVSDLCHKHNIPLIINDDWQIAIQCGADGVHVGADDEKTALIREKSPSDFIIGATAKTVQQALDAQTQGADYIGVGAIFPSPTKPQAVRVTPEELREISRSVRIPTVAIGGINEDNMHLLRGCGNAGIAVISAIFAADDVQHATADLLKKWRKISRTYTALTIAGSDCSGGAGIQADLKTFLANGVYGMSAITALTAQNTTSVTGIHEVPQQFLASQIDAIFSDIRPDAVKIGMIPSSAAAEVIADRLKSQKADHIVLDPVALATTGAKLCDISAFEAVKQLLFPMAELVTPNVPEAELITGMTIADEHDLAIAARSIADHYGCAALCKGGHLTGEPVKNCLALPDGNTITLENRRILTRNTHGTGCTLSSAIAAGLAKGLNLENAVISAESYVHNALLSGLELGHGSGPLDHGFAIKSREEN